MLVQVPHAATAIAAAFLAEAAQTMAVDPNVDHRPRIAALGHAAVEMLKHVVVTARAKSAEKSDSPVPMPSRGAPKQSFESVTQRRQSSTKRNAANMECALCPTALHVPHWT